MQYKPWKYLQQFYKVHDNYLGMGLTHNLTYIYNKTGDTQV